MIVYTNDYTSKTYQFPEHLKVAFRPRDREEARLPEIDHDKVGLCSDLE